MRRTAEGRDIEPCRISRAAEGIGDARRVLAGLAAKVATSGA